MDDCVVLPITQLPAVVASEWIDPDALDGLAVEMESVKFATPLGISEILPVGSAVASAYEARFLDEGFQKDRAIGITGVPVLSQASADQGEDAGSCPRMPGAQRPFTSQRISSASAQVTV
jgi:hypothetical protein